MAATTRLPTSNLRLAPGDDAATVTAGQWSNGDPEILIVVDAGYDVPRLAFLLKDLPVQVLGRMRSDRVLRRAAPPREPGTRGRPCSRRLRMWARNSWLLPAESDRMRIGLP